MARKRDFKSEYRRRIQRGLKRGLSRSQARGHGAPLNTKAKPQAPDKRLEKAVRALQRGKTQKAAAKLVGISPERLRRFVYENKLAKREGRKWVMSDKRPRRVPMIEGGRQRAIIVPGFAEASRVGHHHNAVRNFLRSNETEHLLPFEGEGVEDIKGRFHPFETDPNELHRYASADSPPFHEIYQIIAT